MSKKVPTDIDRALSNVDMLPLLDIYHYGNLIRDAGTTRGNQMKALIEVGFVMHTGKLIHTYVPICIDRDAPSMRMDGLLHHVMKANFIVDMTNRKYIKSRMYPIPDVVSEDIIRIFKTIQLTDISELCVQEQQWRS